VNVDFVVIGAVEDKISYLNVDVNEEATKKIKKN
jgi:hypothetical protein